MKFTKMHGNGNDYIFVDCVTPGQDLSLLDTVSPSRLSELFSDRHFGIGSDGLILIRPSDKADFCMEMYNSDGSRGAMCGNGIRCVAKYVYDHALTNMTTITIETLAGIRTLSLAVKEGKVSAVTVEMGIPVLTSNGMELVLAPPTDAVNADAQGGWPETEGDTDPDRKSDIWEPLSVCGKQFWTIGISMGNPHTVIFCGDVADTDVASIGSEIEMLPRFDDRTNVEFVQVVNRSQLEMRVWERGSGETLACGTGSCAGGVAAILAGFTDRTVCVHLPGGSLKVFWNPESGQVELSGPATEVFSGEIDL